MSTISETSNSMMPAVKSLLVAIRRCIPLKIPCDFDIKPSAVVNYMEEHMCGLAVQQVSNNLAIHTVLRVR